MGGFGLTGQVSVQSKAISWQILGYITAGIAVRSSFSQIVILFY